MSFASFFRSRFADDPILPLTNTHVHPPASARMISQKTPSSASFSRSSARVPSNGRRLAATMSHISSKHHDPYLALSREEEHIKKNLQKLIDAQSEGLLAGFAGTSDHDERDNLSSTGSRTPNTTSIGSTSTPWGLNQTNSHYAPRIPITTPIRQPARRKTGLHGARRGITRAISSLAHLKSSQATLLSSELDEKSSDLSTVQSLSAKQSILEEQIRAIEQREDSSRRISEMKKEEKVLGEEIRDLEDRLWQMKARQNKLLGDIQGLENRVESQLSSYKAALQLAKKEARSLLERAPRTTATATANVVLSGQYRNSSGEGIWSLPPDRRTLPMAEEHFLEEQQTLRRLIEAAKFEQTECEGGAQVWEDVVQSVSVVETMLRTEMQRNTHSATSLPPPRPPLLHHDIQPDDTNNENSATSLPPPRPPLLHHEIQPNDTDNESTESSPEAKIRKAHIEIQRGIHFLESKLSLARQRGWKLLDVCISAEVEAMREGEQVLNDVLDPGPSSSPSSYSYSSRRAEDDLMDADEGEGISPIFPTRRKVKDDLIDAEEREEISPISSRRINDDILDADEREGISPVAIDCNQLVDWTKGGANLDEGGNVWGWSHHQQHQHQHEQREQRLIHVRSAELLVERSEDEYDDEGPGPELLISHF